MTLRPAPPRDPRGDVLALGAVLAWTLGAILARSIGIWAGVGSAAVILGALAAALDGPRLRQLVAPRPSLVALGVLAGGLLVIATHVIYPLVARAVPEVAREAAALYAALGPPSPWRSGLFLPLILVGEDLVWRGVVQDAAIRRLGNAGGTAAAALAYALAHAPLGSPALCGLALACGALWSALRMSTRSLVPVLVSHFLWDMTVMVLYPLVPPPG